MRKIILDRADRLQRMPPEFISLDRLAARLDKKLVRIIDLTGIETGIDAESHPPAISVAEMTSAPAEQTLADFCSGVADYYFSRYGTKINPEREILPISGVNTAFYLLCLAFIDPGEIALLPDPGPPVYRSAVALSGGGAQTYYLYDRNRYIPDCRTIANSLAGRTKIWFMGYPHNPTTASADHDLINEVTRIARRHNILIVHDSSYAWLGRAAPGDNSFFVNARARATGVEVVSFDHTFGLGEQNLAVIVGNHEAITGVKFLATEAGMLPRQGVLTLGQWALKNQETLLSRRRDRIRESREILADALDKLEWPYRFGEDLPYCWLTLPRRYSSLGFTRRLLRRTGVKLTPGTVYGEQGEGYARVALVANTTKMKQAAEKLVEFGNLWQKRKLRKKTTD